MPHDGLPTVTRTVGIGNRLLATLPPADIALLAPELEGVALDQDAVLVRAGDEVEHVFFPHSGAISLMIDMANGQTVATAAIGCEGAVGILSALGPSPSAITAIVHAAGTASRIPASRFRAAFNRSPVLRHALQAHLSAMLTQFQLGAACNALHAVQVRMARWLLNLSDHIDHDVLPLTQEALSQILGVRRTTVTLLMRNLRASGAIRSDRRGQIEIDRSRLAAVACECHETMRLEVDGSASTNTARSRFLGVGDDERVSLGALVARSGKDYSVTAHPTNVGNRLLAALPPADLGLLTPHFQKISFEPDAMLVRSGDELDQVYFPHSGAIAFMVDMPNGQTVATTLMGREGALASLSVLGPSRSSVTAIVRVAGTASRISAAKFRLAYAQGAAIRQVVQVHARTLLLQLQHVAACNALHRVEGRMARWLLQIHDRVPDDALPLTQEALAQLLGVRRTTVTLTMSKLRVAGAIRSDRRGFVEVDRTRLESVACECYALMQRRIDRISCQELSAPRLALALLQESSFVTSGEAGEDRAEIKAASPVRK